MRASKTVKVDEYTHRRLEFLQEPDETFGETVRRLVGDVEIDELQP